MDTFSQEIYALLNNGNYDAARQIIVDNLSNITVSEDDTSIMELYFYYGFLIDIGIESRSESDLVSAIAFMKENEEKVCSIQGKAGFYYNLGNATSGLGKLYHYNNRGVLSQDLQKKYYQEPIQYYWSALAAVSDDDNLKIRIYINLSNALVSAGRIVEAIQFLDSVLKLNAAHPQALVSIADHLNHMTNVTNCSLSVALLVRIYGHYDDGIKTKSLPSYILTHCTHQRSLLQLQIEKEGFDLNDIDKELVETKNEFDQHSDYRKYCILNYLTLNEHGIYCGCVSNKKDDIQIGVSHGMFRTEIVPKMELLLNRLKSEFAFARWAYYQSIHGGKFEFDVQYSDLLDNEMLSPEIELQRTSFRICYGILDKIALGICKIFNIPAKRIHFESFWEDLKIKPLLNDTKNIHVNALFSIANDLNSKTGELKHFKNWRNKLEHNLLILKDTLSFDPDYLKVFEDDEFVVVTDAEEFKEKALHLLQLTRAAIFSFVYCIRLETIEKPDDEIRGRGIPITLK